MNDYIVPKDNGSAGRDMLLESISLNLGEHVLEALKNPDVIEIMLNPDGSLWIDKFGEGMSKIGVISPEYAELAISFIAGTLKVEAGRESPIVEGELPLDSSRFEGLLPPVVPRPTFSIRKKPSKIYTFDDYVTAGNLSSEAKEILEEAVVNHKNILVAGGTGSGKTTFVNAVIEAVARLTPEDRLVIIEDTTELQPKSPNVVQMRSNVTTTMQDLLVATLRLRPDRIMVGEVRRGLPALTLTNSWNTGHEGGVATVHANSAPEALDRLEELITMDNYTPVKKSLARAVNYVVFMKKTVGIRRVTEIMTVDYDETRQDYIFNWKYNYQSACAA